MSRKKKEEEVTPVATVQGLEPKPDCQAMAVCVALGAPGEPRTEALHQLILVVLREKTLDEAGAALTEMYAGLDIEAQRDFVKDLDFNLGVAANVARTLPERFRVK